MKRLLRKFLRNVVKLGLLLAQLALCRLMGYEVASHAVTSLGLLLDRTFSESGKEAV